MIDAVVAYLSSASIKRVSLQEVNIRSGCPVSPVSSARNACDTRKELRAYNKARQRCGNLRFFMCSLCACGGSLPHDVFCEGSTILVDKNYVLGSYCANELLTDQCVRY